MTSSQLSPVISDPLHHLDPLPHQGTFYPLGYRLEVATNSKAVLDAMTASWFPYASASDEPPLELRVIVASHNEGPFPPPPSFRGQEHLLSIVSNRDNFASVDIDRAFAFCRIEPQVAAEPAWMRHHFLEGVVYSILSSRHLVAIHAAGVMRHGAGILLHGPSGTGKSCFAYACARAGWTYLSDDVCFLRRALASRVVLGKPHQIRFLPSAADLFPELRDRPVIPDASGQPMMTINTSTLAEFPTVLQAPVDALVFLERRPSGPPQFNSVDPGEALALLIAELPILTPRSYEEQKQALLSLVRTPQVRLTYSNLDEAVAALDQFAAALSKAGPQ
jgi:hypothetical protein